MPLVYVSGDPLLTRAQTLAFGHNLRARTEVGPLETVLLSRFPAAFATYRKQCQSGRLRAGQFWLWRESQPHLAFCVLRETPQGVSRLRFLESVLMTVARDYPLYNLSSLAFAPLVSREEWPSVRPLLDFWLARSPLPVTVYETYQPGIQAEP